jgi:hypothetical protein
VCHKRSSEIPAAGPSLCLMAGCCAQRQGKSLLMTAYNNNVCSMAAKQALQAMAASYVEFQWKSVSYRHTHKEHVCAHPLSRLSLQTAYTKPKHGTYVLPVRWYYFLLTQFTLPLSHYRIQQSARVSLKFQDCRICHQIQFLCVWGGACVRVSVHFNWKPH